MTIAANIFSPEDLIPRDRWGRPLIIPVDGGKPVAYTRVTTLAKTLDDTSMLSKWMMRTAVTGIVRRPDLLTMASAHVDDKQRLNRIVDDALEAGGRSDKANLGTALHKFCEQIDLGIMPENIPAEHAASVRAYAVMRHQMSDMTVEAVEKFLVCDELETAGTTDRIVNIGGTRYIADIKTGGIDYAAQSIATQLAVYAHSTAYNPETGVRTPIDVDLQRAVVIHLPVGTDECNLHWIDIERGWAAARMANAVRGWRKTQPLDADPFHTVGG